MTDKITRAVLVISLAVFGGQWLSVEGPRWLTKAVTTWSNSHDKTPEYLTFLSALSS